MKRSINAIALAMSECANVFQDNSPARWMRLMRSLSACRPSRHAGVRAMSSQIDRLVTQILDCLNKPMVTGRARGVA